MNSNKLMIAAAVLAVIAMAFVAVPADETDAAEIEMTPSYLEQEIGGVTYTYVIIGVPETVPTGISGTATINAVNYPVAVQDNQYGYGLFAAVEDLAEGTYVISINLNNGAYTAEGTYAFANGEFTPVQPSENSTVTINATGATVDVAGEGVVDNEDGTYTVPNGTAITLTIKPDFQDVESVTVDGMAVELKDGVYRHTVTVSGSMTIVVIATEAGGQPGPGEVTLTGIEVTTPTKTTYKVGEALDLSGMVVTATYSDGSTAEITDGYTTSPVNGSALNTAGTVTVTVTYQGQNYSFDITVEDSDEPGTTVDPDKEFTNSITLSDGAVIDEDSSIYASSTQEVIIAGDVTVANNGNITILGKLTIQEGASLTIENGGEVLIDNNGIVDVQGDMYVEGTTSGYSFTYRGAVMTVSGNVYLEGADSFQSTGTGIEISGLFEVGDEATAQLDGATVAQGGQLNIYGVVNGTVTNSGTITIDSQGFENGTPANGGAVDMDITMKADATVDVINAYGSVVITDAGLTFDGNRANTGIPAKNVSTVTLTNASGVLVTETLVITQDGDKNVNGGYVGTNTMYVSGTVTYAINYDGQNAEGDILIEGDNVEVAADSALGTGVVMTVNGNLTVSANLTATEKADMIVGAGPMTVTGKVLTNGTCGVAVINAAHYTDSATHVYTTLETALTDGATSIDLLGANTVEAGATIPVGTTVTMNPESTLTIAEDATLTVEADDRNSGRMDTKTNNVYVEGTMVVQNMPKSRIDATHVHSDTEKQVEDTMTYTNIYNALENAADGENVEITQAVTLKQDVEVRNGVTLYVPSTMSLTVPNEITVTVNGTLYVAGTYTMAPAVYDGETVEKAPGATVVSGMMVYTNGSEEYTSKIVGASFGYAYTYENRAVANAMAIAPMASVPGLVADITTNDVIVYGDQTVPAVDFSAYDGEGALDTVSVAPGYDVTFESITIGDYIALSTVGDLSVSGTVVLANGTVELDNVNGIVAMNQTNDIEETVTSFISGTVGAYDDPETEAVETGAVSVTGEVATTGTFVANVPVDVPAGATLTVNVGTFSGDVSVEGSAVIAGAGVTFQKLTVTGTVSASDATINATAVKMYVGVTSDDYAMAGTGSVSGVTLANVAKAVAYVSPNATVEGDLTDLMSTAYYADDELYLTAYARNADVPVNEVQLRIENARFDGWMYNDANGAAQKVSDGMNVGEENLAEVYADIEYAIYQITIYADSGIGSIAIDGNVMQLSGANTFVLNTELRAGQHTVTYTFKPQYQGEPALSFASSTPEGATATVSGLTFTLSGTPESSTIVNSENQTEEWVFDVYMGLAGSEPADSTIVIENGGSGDDGLGLTEILLIILVILIVIMAIIVALRLMRS